MQRKRLIMGMVLVLSIALLTHPVWCYEQQDLEGTWDVSVWSQNCLFGTQCWDRCQFTVDSQGNIQGETPYAYWLGGSATITGGVLTVNGNDEIQGTIETSDGTFNVQHGAIVENELFLRMPE